jgi:hypothetical protein
MTSALFAAVSPSIAYRQPVQASTANATSSLIVEE